MEEAYKAGDMDKSTGSTGLGSNSSLQASSTLSWQRETDSDHTGSLASRAEEVHHEDGHDRVASKLSRELVGHARACERELELLLADDLARAMTEDLEPSRTDWSGAASVASYGTTASLEPEKLCALATIGEERALLNALDRVLMDAGQADLPAENVIRRPALNHSNESCARPSSRSAAPSRQRLDASRPASKAQEGRDARPASACSVASVHPGDERYFACDVSKLLWHEICMHLDEDLRTGPRMARAAV